jgi:cobalt-zinc-cadmium efflux system protein
MAAQVSALLLLAAGVWILVEGVSRLGAPVPVQGAGLAVVATLGLVVNAGSAIVVHRAQGESLNMRASFVHLVTDAAGSLGAVIAGIVIVGWGWDRADSVVSIATAALVLWTGWGLLRESTHVLMEGTPRGLDPDEVTAAIRDVDGAVDVHHLHLWNLASDVPAAPAHLVVAGQPTLHEAQAVVEAIRTELADRFGLTHVTLEFEEASSTAPATAPHPTVPGSPHGSAS